MRAYEECHAEPSKLYPYLRWMGHGDLFSNCAFKLLSKKSNAPIPANNRPSVDIECRGHDQKSLQGLFKTEISGFINIS
jgi:hypothetical protein